MLIMFDNPNSDSGREETEVTVADSVPELLSVVVVLAVVFAISAAYAFKKIRDYKNI